MRIAFRNANACQWQFSICIVLLSCQSVWACTHVPAFYFWSRIHCDDLHSLHLENIKHFSCLVCWHWWCQSACRQRNVSLGFSAGPGMCDWLRICCDNHFIALWKPKTISFLLFLLSLLVCFVSNHCFCGFSYLFAHPIWWCFLSLHFPACHCMWF